MIKYSWIVLLVCLLLFPANYFICSFIFPNIETQNDQWWELRTDLCAINLLLLSICLILPKSRVTKYFAFLMISFCVGDVIDRILFNTRTFCLISDSVMVVVSVIHGYFKHYKNYELA